MKATDNGSPILAITLEDTTFAKKDDNQSIKTHSIFEMKITA